MAVKDMMRSGLGGSPSLILKEGFGPPATITGTYTGTTATKRRHLRFLRLPLRTRRVGSGDR